MACRDWVLGLLSSYPTHCWVPLYLRPISTPRTTRLDKSSKVTCAFNTFTIMHIHTYYMCMSLLLTPMDSKWPVLNRWNFLSFMQIALQFMLLYVFSIFTCIIIFTCFVYQLSLHRYSLPSWSLSFYRFILLFVYSKLFLMLFSYGLVFTLQRLLLSHVHLTCYYYYYYYATAVCNCCMMNCRTCGSVLKWLW